MSAFERLIPCLMFLQIQCHTRFHKPFARSSEVVWCPDLLPMLVPAGVCTPVTPVGQDDTPVIPPFIISASWYDIAFTCMLIAGGAYDERRKEWMRQKHIVWWTMVAFSQIPQYYWKYDCGDKFFPRQDARRHQVRLCGNTLRSFAAVDRKAFAFFGRITCCECFLRKPLAYFHAWSRRNGAWCEHCLAQKSPRRFCASHPVCGQCQQRACARTHFHGASSSTTDNDENRSISGSTI